MDHKDFHEATSVWLCEQCNDGKGVVFGYPEEADDNDCPHDLIPCAQYEDGESIQWYVMRDITIQRNKEE